MFNSGVLVAIQHSKFLATRSKILPSPPSRLSCLTAAVDNWTRNWYGVPQIRVSWIDFLV